jgi:hypothetical protein
MEMKKYEVRKYHSDIIGNKTIQQQQQQKKNVMLKAKVL